MSKVRQPTNAVETTLRKAWATLPAEFQAALKGLGLDFTPEPEFQPLEEVLKAHLESLPKEVKEVVERLIKPSFTATVDVTGQPQLELRQLHEKAILAETSGPGQGAVQDYTKQLKRKSCTNFPAHEHVLDRDTTEHVLKALGQAGIIFNSHQQKELERNLAETLAKRRKTEGDTQLSG